MSLLAMAQMCISKRSQHRVIEIYFLITQRSLEYLDTFSCLSHDCLATGVFILVANTVLSTRWQCGYIATCTTCLNMCELYAIFTLHETSANSYRTEKK